MVVVVLAPASDTALCRQGAGVVLPGTDACEGAIRCRSLTKGVIAPAGDKSFRGDATGVVCSGTEVGEGRRWWGHLSPFAIAPAFDCARFMNGAVVL